MRMIRDKAAELASNDMDPFGEQLLASFHPFKVEGLVSSREDYQEPFVWARTQNEAKVQAASLAAKTPHMDSCEMECRIDETSDQIMPPVR